MIITLRDNEGPTLAGFRFFWLKRVTGFNPVYHCAKCLAGSLVTSISHKLPAEEPVAFFSPSDAVYYLCGVSAPYVHAKNFHLAMRYKLGESIEKRLYTGARVLIQHAEEITFSDAAARNRYGNKGPEFLTCRNFQFGAHHFGESRNLL